MVGLEVQRTVGLEEAPSALFPITALQSALRVSRTFLNEDMRLDAAATAVGLQAQYGWLARAEFAYVLQDNLQLGMMYVHYGAGNNADVGPFTDWTNMISFGSSYAGQYSSYRRE